ncbi:MAG: methylenetetrahydrofolate reductase [Thermoguttaceae bacterium]|jgi:methylenetetrahydrofolate reductase (NADPH)
MSQTVTRLAQRIASGQPLVMVEMAPPAGADPAPLREAAKRYAGKVDALALSDNRDRVSMSALAAAAIVAGEGIEPILHVTTRDRNRIALVSEALGACALGLRNVLCTSGTHQTLGPFRAARSVYDIDVVQLLQAFSGLAADGSMVGQPGFAGAGPFCLGAAASPAADPLELQLSRLRKKVTAGAAFLVTQPVWDLERFGAWWSEVTRRGLPQQVAILAAVRPLAEADLAEPREGKPPSERIPPAAIQRVASADGPAARRAAAVGLALETIQKLSGLAGLRGWSISADGDLDAPLEILDKSGLRSS